MRIGILNSANNDLIDGYWFYEKQMEGIGSYFLNSLFSDIDSLKIYAGIHPIHFEKYHRLLAKRFPFAIYYCVKNDTAFIYAVLDCRRNPAWIRNKLE
ncbi:type II toxin-antitoxin system RelE/ParE family toxin [Candidatus Desantisbacteria bacterium]|nr:type II toxin-antitoxin system RelE/ParE family toxin [Candidatus Desantisbacteria bacterium]